MQAHLGDRRAGGGRHDPQPHLFSGHRREPQETPVPDARPPGDLLPSAIFPHIGGECIDALAEGQVLAKADDVEGDGPAEVEEVTRTIQGLFLTAGPRTRQFEEWLAQYLGAAGAVGVF